MEIALCLVWGLWLLFIGTKLVSALLGGLVGLVRALRQKGANE